MAAAVSGCDAPLALQLTGDGLNPISTLIEKPVAVGRRFARLSTPDARAYPFVFWRVSELIGTITNVAESQPNFGGRPTKTASV